MSHLRLCLAALAFAGCAATPASTRTSSGPVAQIEIFEWKRSNPDGQLDVFARTHAEAAVRARAVRALGRLQDPVSLISIRGALADAAPEVRFAAAEAAHLFGLSWQPLDDGEKGELVEALTTGEPAEKEAHVRRAMLGALGRLATPAAMDHLVERLAEPEWAATAAIALGAAQRNKGKVPDSGYAPLMAMLESKDAATRSAATYALCLTKDARALGGLVQALRDTDLDAQAWAAKGLGDLLTADTAKKSVSEAAQADAAAKLGALISSPVGGPQLEAARALAKLAKGCTRDDCPALAALDAATTVTPGRLNAIQPGGPPEYGTVAFLAVAQTGLPEAGRKLLVRWREKLALSDPSSGTVFKAGDLDCRLAAAIDRLDGAPSATSSCGLGAVNKAWALAMALKEIAQDPPKAPLARVELAKEHLKSADPRVRSAAVELLGSSNAMEARPIARALLDDKDPIIAAGAAMAVAALKDEEALPNMMVLAAQARRTVDVAPAIAEALVTLGSDKVTPVLETWLDAPEATVRHSAAAAISALKKVTVRSAERERTALPTVAPVYGKVVAVLVTRLGEIELTLDGDLAPITVGNFVALAKKRYFNGTTIHRVVPNFVAQGGDPRGDGEGGPGYTIPCETSARPYVRGTVGMALAGKDTGGSQYFLTLSRQPHLEGRYTVFGEVTKGIERADFLLESDTIERVEIRSR
jgi:cyclophilin family peptidyl-prolyl cis-trans isomerase/HEAT repeat protein